MHVFNRSSLLLKPPPLYFLKTRIDFIKECVLLQEYLYLVICLIKMCYTQYTNLTEKAMSKINQISRSPAFDLQSPGKESFCFFVRIFFDYQSYIGAKYKQKRQEVTYLAFSFTKLFRGGGSPEPPQYSRLLSNLGKGDVLIHFSRFGHTVGGRSPASPSFQVGSSVLYLQFSISKHMISDIQTMTTFHK